MKIMKIDMKVFVSVSALFLVSFVCNDAYSKDNASDAERYQHKCWTLYITHDGGEKECVLLSFPIAVSGNYAKRGDAYLSVRYVSKNINEVSVSPGYPPTTGDGHTEMHIYSSLPGCIKANDIAKCEEPGGKDKSHSASLVGNTCKGLIDRSNAGKCTTLINKRSAAYHRFEIFEDEQAWVKDSETDTEIVEQMMKGHYAIVGAKSKIGSCSADIYSLFGFKSAYEQMKSKCAQKYKGK